MPTNKQRHAWWMHLGCLAAMAVASVVLTWDAWFPPPGKTLNLEVIGAVFLMMFGLGYALVTSLVMLWAARYRWSPLVIHGSVITILGLGAYGNHKDNQRREAQYQAEQDERLRHDEDEHKRRACLHVELVKVSLGPPMRASLTLENHDCVAPMVVRDVDLWGFKGGGNRILITPYETRRTPVRLEVGARHTFTLGEAIPSSDPPALEGWSWKTNVDVEEPESMNLCFATTGAPERTGCNSIDRVTLEPGR